MSLRETLASVPEVQRSGGLDCATDLGAADDERGLSCLSSRARDRRILVHDAWCLRHGRATRSLWPVESLRAGVQLHIDRATRVSISFQLFLPRNIAQVSPVDRQALHGTGRCVLGSTRNGVTEAVRVNG